MTLATLLASARAGAGGLAFDIPEAWMQGRTAYGGLSSALALHAAQTLLPDLPPLRTAQVSFVGPVGGSVTVSAELLRRGRNAAFVRADVRSDAGLGLSATFVFMGSMASAVDFSAMPAPATLTDTLPPMAAPPAAPRFLDNFELLRVAQEDQATLARWVRLKAYEGLDPMIALLAVADALPPAALKLASTPGPISSMTWLVNLLTPAPVTRDGWWLLRSGADYAKDGCSSQTMTVWNADGVPIASGMQSIALFV